MELTLGVWLRTLRYYFVFTLLVVVFLIPALIVALLPESWRYESKLYAVISQLVYRAMLWSAGIKVTYTGWENIPDRPVIFAANHQSLMDIPILGRVSKGRPHVWFLKEDLQRIPVFGFFVRRMGILVDRRTLGKAIRAIKEGLSVAVCNGCNIMIFPEGGRYTQLHDFLVGFAILAKATQRPVVPVMLYDVYKAYPPGSFFVWPVPVRAVIGPPFTFNEAETEREFTARVKQWFNQQEQQT